jgi:hypothetical protein
VGHPAWQEVSQEVVADPPVVTDRAAECHDTTMSSSSTDSTTAEVGAPSALGPSAPRTGRGFVSFK